MVLENYQRLTDQQKDLLRKAGQVRASLQCLLLEPAKGQVQPSLLTSRVRKRVRCQPQQR